MRISKELTASKVDVSNDVVTFYFTRHNVPDLHNDTIPPDAFIYDLPLVRHFRNHSYDHIIGKIISIDQDDKGYYATSRIIDEYWLKLYQNDVINQHSFTAEVLEYTNNLYGGLELRRMKLIEVSSLSFLAAQVDTPVKKSLNEIETILKSIWKIS